METTKQTAPVRDNKGWENVDVGDDEGANGEKYAKMCNSSGRDDREVGVGGRGEEVQGNTD